MDAKARKVIVTAKNEFTFAAITGKGIDTQNKKNKIYKVAQTVSKKEEKRIRKIVLKFWDENKSKEQGKHPANWDNLVYKSKNTKQPTVAPYTYTMFDDQEVTVGIIDGKQNKLDPKVYGNIGEGTTGSVSFNIKMYENGDEEGVSMFLNAVQLATFSPYSGGGDGTGAFGEMDGDDLGSDDGFKKKKKKKVKSKIPEIDINEDEIPF